MLGKRSGQGGIAAHVRPGTLREGRPAGSPGTSREVVPELSNSSSAPDWLLGAGGVWEVGGLAVPAHCQ